MSELLTVIARVRAKTGKEARLRQELRGLVTPTRAEAGCVSYDLHESKNEPGQFIFYETWKTDADVDAHFQTPHMLAILKLVPELVDGPIDLTKWAKL
jgi:quinol monooxygenase YgiN